MLEITGDSRRIRRATVFFTSGLRAGFARPVVDRLFPLEEVAKARRYPESGTRFGRVVVTVARAGRYGRLSQPGASRL